MTPKSRVDVSRRGRFAEEQRPVLELLRLRDRFSFWDDGPAMGSGLTARDAGGAMS